ncbi:MAG: DUF5659 domain-containing protein [Nitrosopumilaceae archaeon]
MDKKQYETSDIVLAACLKINGFNMTTINVSGTKGTFVFDDVPAKFLTDFDLGHILVEPVSFYNQVKQLTTSVRRLIKP